MRGVIFIVLQINLNSSVEITLQYDQFFVQYALAFLAFFWYFEYTSFSSVQFSSLAQYCPIPCNPMDCSMPGFPVYHQLPELAQTHVHGVGDAFQPSHPLSSPSPPALNLSQQQDLFQ